MRKVFEAAIYPEFGPSYPLGFSNDREGSPVEGGSVRFAWDAEGLHVEARLEDAALVSLNRADEQLHYESGDVFELFLKPIDSRYKWEMYATPFGNKSTLFFPEWPTQLSPLEALENHAYRELDVITEITDTGWNVRMFVPVTQLTALGAGWGDHTQWAVFCGRYNYPSEHLIDPELSMAPPLSSADYHLVDEYAALKLNGTGCFVDS